MKFAVVFAILLAAASSHPVNENEELEYFIYRGENGQIYTESLVGQPENLTASAKDVTYHYYSKSNPDTSVQIHSDNIEALSDTAFDVNKETIFIIHGWKNSHQSDVNSRIREFILRDHDINVFVVDWSPIAGRTYITAQGSVKQVGEYVGDFARSLSSSYGLNLSQLKFVGHSLGAHIAGNAGAALDGQVDRIVGLDPAGPLFKDNNKDNRIDDSDAINVQIIHTNGGTLGYKAACGDSDFYPNGGSSQPGCILDVTGSCSHSKAYDFYAESLTTDQFVAQQCNSYKEYTSGACTGPTSSMGMFNIDKDAKGDYYLQTNKKSPYAQG